MFGFVEYLPPATQRGDLIVGDMILSAGQNQVDIEKWFALADNPLIKQRIERGILRVTFADPTIIVPDSGKKEKVPRTASPVETKLNAEPTVGIIEPIVQSPIEPEKPFAKK